MQEQTLSVERLNALGNKICSERGRPLNLADLESLEPSDEVLGDLKVCLGSNDPVVLSTGFFYLNALTLKRTILSLPSNFLHYLRLRLPELLFHDTSSVKREAIVFSSFLADSINDYRVRMLQFLKSSDPAIREAALRCYQRYARPGEIEPLLGFEEDPVADEIEPMGPWRYSLRDLAFKMTEEHLGRTFPKLQRRASFQGGTIEWLDWKPIFEWYRNAHLRVVK